MDEVGWDWTSTRCTHWPVGTDRSSQQETPKEDKGEQVQWQEHEQLRIVQMKDSPEFEFFFKLTCPFFLWLPRHIEDKLLKCSPHFIDLRAALNFLFLSLLFLFSLVKLCMALQLVDSKRLHGELTPFLTTHPVINLTLLSTASVDDGSKLPLHDRRRQWKSQILIWTLRRTENEGCWRWHREIFKEDDQALVVNVVVIVVVVFIVNPTECSFLSCEVSWLNT